MSIIHVEANNSENEIAFFTRQEDGESGMTVTALGKFCGVTQQAVSKILNLIRDSNPTTNNLPECLKPFAGKEQRVITNKEKNSLYVKDELCHAILEYYTFDAREYKGKSIAIQNYKTFAKAGVRVYIWSQTGYQPEKSLIDKCAAKILKYLENDLEISKDYGNQKDILRSSKNLTNYLITSVSPTNRIKLLVDPVKAKIFEELRLKGKLNYESLRNDAMLRRKSIRELYGSMKRKALRKAEVIKMLEDFKTFNT